MLREDVLLERITRFFGIEFDDASLIRLGDHELLLKVDSFDWSLHMLPLLTFRRVGIKSVVAPVSDVLVKGGAPAAALLSLRVPRSFGEEQLQQLLAGVREAAEKYGLRVVGGDTDVVEGDPFRLDVFVVARLTGKYLSRREAKPGDVIAITGRVGLSAAVQAFSLNPVEVRCQLTDGDLEEYAWGNLPDPRAWLAVKEVVKASLDNSDGLALSLHYLSESSAVRLELEEVPLHPLLLECFGEGEALERALYHSGEEYNFIFTLPEEREDLLERVNATLIGRVKQGKGVYLHGYGEVRKFGWVGGMGYAERL
uniref:Thiamine-monophosphate kinase n=1 Tax=Thermofilum pendens TaxID=2269 RepID=A0A7C4FCM3_THEPE